MEWPFLKNSFLHYELDINQAIAQTNEKTILLRCLFVVFFFFFALLFNPQGIFLTIFHEVSQLYLTGIFITYNLYIN